MSERPRAARVRPQLTDPPFLCADCRHGHVIAQRLQSWLLSRDAWKEDWPDWFWQASCRSPKITPWKFTVFVHPVVECDAFRSRKILTTEDRKRPKRKKRKKRSKS